MVNIKYTINVLLPRGINNLSTSRLNSLSKIFKSDATPSQLASTYINFKWNAHVASTEHFELEMLCPCIVAQYHFSLWHEYVCHQGQQYNSIHKHLDSIKIIETKHITLINLQKIFTLK